MSAELDLAIANERIDELIAQVKKLEQEKQAVTAQLTEAKRVIKEQTDRKSVV